MTDLGDKTWLVTPVPAFVWPGTLVGRVQGSIEEGSCKALDTAFACYQIAIRSNWRQWLAAVRHVARRIKREAFFVRRTTQHTKRKTRTSLALPVVVRE